ncbi:MAG: MFS transporter [Spirochaetales bacterium]|nr:MFS transporter [Spirochaetales bacterium]
MRERLVARLPFFYGWVVLGAGTLGVIMSIPGQTVGVSVFTDFLLEALGLERLQLSLAYLLGTLGSAALLSFAGRLYDRWGARILGTAAAVILGAVLLNLSAVGTGARGLGALAAITVSFFALRFAGQGVLTMVSRNMVMKWFDRRRGLANGFLGVATSFGFSYAPRLLDGFIGSWGWRGAYRMLAAICAVFTGFVLLVYREEPARYGLIPDGKLHTPQPKASRIRAHPQRDLTRAEALRTRVFWIFTLTLSLSGLVTTAFTFHVISIFELSGLPREQAVGIFLPASVVAVTLQMLGSYLSDFVKLKYFCLLQLAGLMLGSAGLFFLGPGWPALLIILGHGIISAMFSINVAIAWPRYFGLSHLGAVTGYAMAWMTAGSAAGPYVFSLLLKLGHGYASGAVFSFAAAAGLFAFALLGYDRDY